ELRKQPSAPPELTADQYIFRTQLSPSDRALYDYHRTVPHPPEIEREHQAQGTPPTPQEPGVTERVDEYPLWLRCFLTVFGAPLLLALVLWFQAGNLLLLLHERLEETESVNERPDPTDEELAEKEGRA